MTDEEKIEAIRKAIQQYDDREWDITVTIAEIEDIIQRD